MIMESDSILIKSAASTSADFDAFAWVEKALTDRSGNASSLLPLMPQLALRSQTLAQTLHAALQQVSLSGPTLQTRLEGLQQAMTPLCRQMDTMHEACASGTVASATSASSEELRHLVTLHEAKRRLQSCSQILVEAERWNRNARACFAAIEDPTLLSNVLKADGKKLKPRTVEGDVADHLADRVREMQTSLDVLKDIPGAQARQETLDRLCAQIEAAVQPRLATMLQEDDLGDVAPLRWCLHVLGSVDRANLVRHEFCRARPARVHRVWHAYSNTIQTGKDEKDAMEERDESFSSWLDHFYKDVLRMLQHESRNARDLFSPDEVMGTLVDLLCNTLEPLVPSFRDRLVGTESSRADFDLGQLLRCFNVTRAFAGDTVQLFKSVSRDLDMQLAANEETAFNAQGILQVVFEPYRVYFTEYARFTSEALTDALLRLVPAFHASSIATERSNDIFEDQDQDAVDAAPLNEFSQHLEKASEAVWSLVDESLQQCYEFTGGAAFPEAIEAISTAVQQFTLALSATIPDIRKYCNAEASLHVGEDWSASFAISPDWSHFHASLALLKACGVLESQVCALDSRVRVRMREQLAQFRGEVSEASSPRSRRCKKSHESINIALADLVDPTKLVATVSKLWLQDEDTNRQAQLYQFKRELLDHLVGSSTVDTLPSRYPTATVLDEAQRAVRTWTKEAQLLTYDTVYLPILQTLETLPNNENWQKVPDVALGDMPVFSMLPQDYITIVADLLLSLLPQLEPFAQSSSLENAFVASRGAQELCVQKEWARLGQLLHLTPLELTTCQRIFESDCAHAAADLAPTAMEFVDVWTATFASGALAAFLHRVCSIRVLTDMGAQQLAADLNYFHNVLSAVGGESNFIVDDLRRALETNMSLHLQHVQELREDRDSPAKQALAKINDCIVAMRRQTLEVPRRVSAASASSISSSS